MFYSGFLEWLGGGRLWGSGGGFKSRQRLRLHRNAGVVCTVVGEVAGLENRG